MEKKIIRKLKNEILEYNFFGTHRVVDVVTEKSVEVEFSPKGMTLVDENDSELFEDLLDSWLIDVKKEQVVSLKHDAIVIRCIFYVF